MENKDSLFSHVFSCAPSCRANTLTHTPNHLFPPLLLKSTVITGDDSPPVFCWNVKITHTHTHTCVVLIPVQPVCSVSSISTVQVAFRCGVVRTSSPSRISVLSAAVSGSASVCVQYLCDWLSASYECDACSKWRCSHPILASNTQNKLVKPRTHEDTPLCVWQTVQEWLACQYQGRLSVSLSPPPPQNSLWWIDASVAVIVHATAAHASLYRLDVRLWMRGWSLSSRHNKRLNAGRAAHGVPRAVHRGTSAHLPAAASAADSSHSWQRDRQRGRPNEARGGGVEGWPDWYTVSFRQRDGMRETEGQTVWWSDWQSAKEADRCTNRSIDE